MRGTAAERGIFIFPVKLSTTFYEKNIETQIVCLAVPKEISIFAAHLVLYHTKTGH